jgi:inner membrane protein
MTGRTHDLISFASLLTITSIYPPESLNLTTTVACLMGSVVGALVPDMDQATNRLWDMLPAGNFVGRVFRHLMLQHRTISHSIIGAFIFYKILDIFIPKLLNPDYVNSSIVIVSLMIGYVSHLIADSLTKEGVPLFFPLQFKIGIPPIRSLRITTGKFVETIIIFPGVLIYVFWLIYQKKEIFINLIHLIRS